MGQTGGQPTVKTMACQAAGKVSVALEACEVAAHLMRGPGVIPSKHGQILPVTLIGIDGAIGVNIQPGNLMQSRRLTSWRCVPSNHPMCLHGDTICPGVPSSLVDSDPRTTPRQESCRSSWSLVSGARDPSSDSQNSPISLAHTRLIAVEERELVVGGHLLDHLRHRATTP